MRRGGEKMVDTNKLRGKMVEKGYTQKSLAKKLDLHYMTVFAKLRDGNWTLKEVERLMELLDLEVETFIERRP